ncbi:FkbM family methyltransferase [Roseibium sp.]|uniref:FkbM family methyltransferase n=1 Tax=Roseibium sp. TaxID=1936156 RepID=UPI003264844B
MTNTPERKKKKRSGKRSRTAQKLLFRIENRRLFLRLLDLYTKLNKSWKVAVSDGGRFFQVTDRQGNRLHIIHKNRLPFYKSGVPPRVNGLLDDYMIDRSALRDGDVFIDCGANIGEIGVGLGLTGKALRYIAFEPGQEEHGACSLNNPESSCEKTALWKETCVLKFYEKSDSADSSLIEFGGHETVTEVPATTIDAYCASRGVGAVRYLKIEAEGAEPEVLEGAVDTLRRTQFVTVDCGYERGFDQESTLPTVCNQLIRNGFDLVRIQESRLIALFENKALEKAE